MFYRLKSYYTGRINPSFVGRQCGKPFKPEKLHGHMKSCKGMKAMSKCGAANAAENASMDFNSVSGHLLTH